MKTNYINIIIEKQTRANNCANTEKKTEPCKSATAKDDQRADFDKETQPKDANKASRDNAWLRYRGQTQTDIWAGHAPRAPNLLPQLSRQTRPNV